MRRRARRALPARTWSGSSSIRHSSARRLSGRLRRSSRRCRFACCRSRPLQSLRHHTRGQPSCRWVCQRMAGLYRLTDPHGQPGRRHPLRDPSVPSLTRLHGLGRPDALARYRRHDRDLHTDPRRHAPLAPGRRPGTPLPRRRRRQLLRPGRTAGSLGHVLVPALPTPQSRSARVRTTDRLPGRRLPRQRPPARRGRRRALAPDGIRHRRLLHDLRHRRLRRPRLHRRRRHAGVAARRRAQLSLVGSDLRRRSIARRPDARHRRPPVHGRRRGAAGLLRRYAPQQSARRLDPDSARTDGHRRQLAAAPAGLRLAARHRPPQTGATTDGIAPRLTNVLRQWIPRDSGWPANWLSDVDHLLPKQTIAIVPAGAGVGVMKEQYASSLQLLMAVCGLVLLIACANVANLLLARSVARRTQTAVRMAIGASRSQIVTQALVESILLAIGGGIAGLVVAMGAARLLLSLAFSVSTFLPISTRPSPLVLAFAFGVAVITGVLFGAVPAWLATRTDPIDALRGSGRSTGDHSSFTRTALLVLQATLSVVLVAGATMLGRSLNNVQHQDFGFTVPDRVLVAINRPSADYTVPRLTAMYRALEDRLNRIPGVQSTNLALYNPLTDNWGELILVAGHPPPKPGDNAGASWDRVSAHYLQNLGTTMARG